MKKITDYIVEKRYFFVFFFLFLAVVSIMIQNKVTINNDITKYLPNTSEMKQGMSIMEEEFQDNRGTLNIMFKGLKEEEKEVIHKKLETFSNVSTVKYNNQSEFNNGDYTLYIINMEGKDEEQDRTFRDIINFYEDYNVSTSGNVAERNKTVLPFYVVAIAVLSALVILIIMSNSYVEPFLFLFSILIAVALNKGTNLLLGEVSSITDSISSILQMALSMDYSIMLMNRYNQEKETDKDKKSAMKKALHHSFKSISSSSLTTIVGLLALIFMSFTIGKDLGIVLAKGVLFSLLSIFFVLPGLILIFDKWIEKTKKKSISPNLNKLSKISFKCRYIALGLFFITFLISFLLKGNLSILYTDSSEDEISSYFKEENQIAILYKNKEEEKIKEYVKKWMQNKKLNEVLSYSNTINEPLTYKELNGKLKSLGSNIEIDEYLLKIIYYEYFNKEENNKMSVNELVNMVKNELYENENIRIDNEIKNNVERLSNFSSREKLEKKRTKEELGNMLSLNKEMMDQLFIYYTARHQNTKMTLKDFLIFVNKEILPNKAYSKNIDENTKLNIVLLNDLITGNKISTKMSKQELASLLKIDQEKVNNLWIYYTVKNDITDTLSIHEWTNFVLHNIVSNPLFETSFDQEMIENLELIDQFSNKEWIDSPKNKEELSKVVKLEEDVIKQLLFLKYSSQDNKMELTVKEWMDAVTYLKMNTTYLDDFDMTILNKVPQDLQSSSERYDATTLSGLLNIDSNIMYKMYALIALQQNKIESWTMTPYELVTTILSNDEIKNVLDDETKYKLTLLIEIMNSEKNNQRYTYQEMGNILQIPSDKIKQTYAVYLSETKNLTLTPKELMDLILNNRNDEVIKQSIEENTITSLLKLNQLMNEILLQNEYDSNALSNILGIDKEMVSLIYGLYFSNADNQMMSLNQFIDFMNKDIMTNQTYNQTIDSNSKQKLKALNTLTASVMNETQYRKEEMSSLLSQLESSFDKSKLELAYIYDGSEKQLNENKKMTIEEWINYLHDNLLKDERFKDFIDQEKETEIKEAKKMIDEAKAQLVGKNYSRVIINSKLDLESDETIHTLKTMKKDLKREMKDTYFVGDSLLALEMNETFDKELNFITVLTMLSIFIVVACSFKSLIVPFILVLIIQCSIYMTMGILSFSSDGVYFIALLIVQSILMGATIDYAIVYTSYYIESRRTYGIKESIQNAYNKSIHTILTSSSILMIVTLIVGVFSSQIAAKICKTLSQGTLCSTILILLLLPGILGVFDRWIIKKKQKI